MIHDLHCDNCFYYRKMQSGNLLVCSYIFIRNRRRPCPPGEGCTVKIPVVGKGRAKGLPKE